MEDAVRGSVGGEGEGDDEEGLCEEEEERGPRQRRVVTPRRKRTHKHLTPLPETKSK